MTQSGNGETLKLVTWNCCRGRPERKLPHLAHFDADIAVLQECARPAQESRQCLWFGDNPRQGILVVASGRYRLRALPARPRLPKFIIPIAVTGPKRFTLFAVWAKRGTRDRYVMGVIKALRAYREYFDAGQVVVIGDINSNAIWDDDFPPNRGHTALVKLLDGHGLVSCYHEHFGEAHGAESRPTCYLLWQERRPYHLDYCFVPKRWAARLESVEVGTFDEWKDHSDHRPVVVRIGQQLSSSKARTERQRRPRRAG